MSGFTWLGSYLQAGGSQYADGGAFHGYLCEDAPGKPCYAPCQSGIECAGAPLETMIEGIRNLMASNGLSGKPIYDTEGGWQQNMFLTDPNQQEAYIARWYIIQASEGLASAIWYAWGGSNDGPTAYGSLVNTATNTPNGAASAYTVAHGWIDGATFSAACSSDSANVWTCSLTLSNGKPALVVWNGNETSSNFAAPSQYTQYQDLTGGTFSITAGSVPIGSKPILLE
jgi:hypothetical protein